MLRIALLAALALPLVACVEPTEEYHSVTWTPAVSIDNCDEVKMTVTFANRTEEYDYSYGCSASGGFSWASDDPPRSVELFAYETWERECEYLELFCNGTTTDYFLVGSATGALDLTSDVTPLVIQPAP